MSLRNQISPLLEDFKQANGRGSMASANQALTKIIETLLTHIEQIVSNPVVYSNFPKPEQVFRPVEYVNHFGCIPTPESLQPPLKKLEPKVVETVQAVVAPTETVDLASMSGPDYVEKPKAKRPGPKPKKLSELKQPHRAKKMTNRPPG